LVLWARSEKIGCAVSLCPGIMECWNNGIMGSGLRLREGNGMVGLENQTEYNGIDFYVIVVYFPGRKRKMDALQAPL